MRSAQVLHLLCRSGPQTCGWAAHKTPELSDEQLEEQDRNWPGNKGVQQYVLCFCSQGGEQEPSFAQLASSGFQIQ